MNSVIKTTLVASALLAGSWMTASVAQATVLLEYDAATAGADIEPNDVGWSVSTNDAPAMTNNGTYLLQDKTGVADQQYGEYLSPSLGAGTFVRGGADYGIEFRVRPQTDVQFIGSHWPEMYLVWSDDTYIYNITVDKFAAGTSSGNGDIVYGQGSFSPAISNIDWTVPHTIFIGHRASGPDSVFDFYLDGNLVSTIVDGSIGRTSGHPYAQDRIGFGDGTSGGSDVAGEWYFVRVHDVNAPIPEPASVGLLLGGAGLLLGRRRS